ncbi:hypothetical protein [Streptomyces lavendulocolor]
MQAADLFEQGMRQSKVAEVLGVTPGGQPVASGLGRRRPGGSVVQRAGGG